MSNPKIIIDLEKIDTSKAFSQVDSEARALAVNVEAKLSSLVKNNVSKSFSQIESQTRKVTQSFVDQNKKIQSTASQSFSRNITSQSESIRVSFRAIKESSDAAFESVNDGSRKASGALSETGSGVSKLSIALASTGVVASANLGKITEAVTKISSGLSGLSTVRIAPQGLFGITLALTEASLVLKAFSLLTQDAESSLVRLISRLANFTAIVIGGLSVAIGFAIVKVAQLGQEVSRNLIEGFQRASESFLKFDKQTGVFGATVDSVNRNIDGNIGTLRSWQSEIVKTSKQFNILESDLIKSAQEIALVGSKIGLNEQQLKRLLTVSAEYAKVNQKDVFQTTVNLVNALNGQAQAVTAYGIKLGQASVQQFAYTQGLTKNVNTLTESERVQLRFNSLIKQYGVVAGIGEVAAGSLADQGIRLEQSLERVNRKIGEGASIIENNNILALAFNKILNGLNDEAVRAAGFFGALGSRLLQVGSFALEFSFKIFAITKVISLLNLALSSNVASKAFSRNLSIVGRSIDDITSSLAGKKIAIRSVADGLNFLGQAFLNQIGLNNSLSKSNGILSTSFNILSASLSRARMAFSAALVFLTPLLLPILKISLALGAVIGVFTGLFKAFQAFEQRTGALVGIYNIFLSTLRETGPVFAGLIEFFGNLKTVAVDLAVKGFGFLTDKIAASFGFITSILAKNPLNIFSKQSVQGFNEINQRIAAFRSNLQAVAFDIRKIPVDADRAIASVASKSNVNLEELAQKLEAIRAKFQNFGLSQVEIVRKQEAEELRVLQESFANKLILEQEFQTRRAQVIQDAQNRIDEINKKANDKLAQQAGQYKNILENGFAQTTAFAFEKVGASLFGAKDAFNNFGGEILSIIGDIAVQLGLTLIKKGLAIDALAASLATLTGGFAIAAGVALVALGGGLKSFGSGLSGAGTGGNTGIGSASDILNQPSTDFETTSPTRESRKAKDPTVNLTIQGSVFDSEETGTTIAKILSDAFGKQGVTLSDPRFA